MAKKPTYQVLEQRLKELENEAPRRHEVEEELRESEKKYHNLFQNAPVGIGVVDEDGNIIDFNEGILRPGGYNREDIDRIGNIAEICYVPNEGKKLLAMARDRGFCDEIEVQFKRKDGSPYDALLSVKPTKVKGRPCWLVLVQDITERKRAEEALRESYEFTSSVLDYAPNPILVINPDTSIRYVNSSLEELTGFSCGELIGKKTPYPWWPEKTLQKIGKDLQEGMLKEAQRLKEVFQKKNGDLFHVEITLTAIRRNGKLKYYLANWVDVTERTEAEEALRETIKRMQIAYDQSTIYARQLNREIAERKRVEGTLLTYHERLRGLASELALAEERQRRRIAIDVHDHIAQNLAFAKMKLGTFRTSIASGGALETMDDILKLVDETIRDTRSLISELGSPVLYELGFVPAVEWLTQQAQRQHGIVVDFEDDGQPKPLSEDVRVLLFQAARELLVNIAKHAKARTAKVSITRDGDQVRVDVEDDGAGFDTAKLASSVVDTSRFGLFSIRVRLEPLGGHIQVESERGHGTQVALMAPLKRNGGNKNDKAS